MDTIFKPRRNDEVRSGGKIVKGRRIAAAKTPYDRPPPPPPPPPQNPNWLTELVFPATRMIASGAGKLISSVFGPDASSSSDSDSSSEDDVEDDNGDCYVTPGGNDGLVKKNGISSETIKRFKEPQSTFWKTKTGGVVEQLLMQETFSREECERLMKIISSRVVDNSIIKEGPYGRLSEIPSGTIDIDIPDICSKAVMEAKKWLEEKKVVSSSKSDLEHGTCTLNSAELPQVAEGEVGSPVDMAKSYMQVRPSWASPSLIHSNLKSPSSVGIELFKENTPYSAGVKKRDSLSTGSWNILEEIRRVRSKATEDMLRTLPSANIDLSPFSLELKTAQDSSVADKTEVGMCHEMHDPNSLTAARTINSSENLARGDSTCHVVPVLDTTQDGLGNGALLSTPDITTSEKNQALESIKIIEGGEGAAYRSHNSTAVHTDSRSSDINCDVVKEVTESGATPVANGFPPSGSSFSAKMETRENARASNDENPYPVNPSHGKMSNSIPVEETCELLSEASVEVPVVYETNSVVSGSRNSSSVRDDDLSQQPNQIKSKRNLAGEEGGTTGKQQGSNKQQVSGSRNSSSMRDEDLSQQPNQIKSKRNLAGKVGGTTGKQQGRKLSGYSRKVRGRGTGK